MTKTETQKLTNTIKGYYNSQFFIDEFVINAWYEELKEYELQDAMEHIKKYLKQYPDTPPKPHTFIKGLLTRQEKQKLVNEKYFVECNLCHKWMGMNEYEKHYGDCLTIDYLISIAKEKGENITRKELEHCRKEVIDRLYEKYKPNDSWMPKIINESNNIPG